MSDAAKTETTSTPAPFGQQEPREIDGPSDIARAERIQKVLAERGGKLAKVEDKPEPKPDPEEPAETEEATSEEAEKTDEEKAAEAKSAEAKTKDEKPPPKTARGKEWAAIEKKKAEVARVEREVRREREQAAAERAELLEYRRQLDAGAARLQELDKLVKTNPKKFIEEITGGDLRSLMKAAMEEPQITPEQKRLRELDEEVKALKAEREAERKAAEEAKKVRTYEERTAAQRAQDEANLAVISGALDGNDRFSGQTQKMKQIFARQVYENVLAEFNSTGREPQLSKHISALADELFPQPATPKEPPPAQANGAEQTAKPGAKRAPVLSSAAAASKASGNRKETREEMLKRLAKNLTRPSA